MKSKKKIVTLLACAVLLVVGSVMGTMAYLTSQDDVVNTFTVGKVAITMDEADVKADGTYVSDKTKRTDANQYHLIPGHTYIKDPTVHVDPTSEPSWLFVQVLDGLAGIEDADTIAAQMTANGWTEIADNVYAYKEVVEANDNIVVFNNFKIRGNADVSQYANAVISVKAYAVQADGFGTAGEAWAAAPTDFNFDK